MSRCTTLSGSVGARAGDAVSELIEARELVLLVLGLAAFGVVVLPHVLSRWPLSYPIIFVGVGALLFSLPHGITRPDPIRYAEATATLGSGATACAPCRIRCRSQLAP